MAALAGAAAVLGTLFSGCGGGDGAAAAPRAEPADVSRNSNPLAEMAGTYVVACYGQTYHNDAGPQSWSNQGSLTITAAPGTDVVEISIHAQDYRGSPDCAESTLNADAVVTGELNRKDATRTYTDDKGVKVIAKVLTATYRGLSLSKGSLSGKLPLLGATTDIAYVLDGAQLRVSKGGREADGLGDSLSAQVAVRQ